MPSHPVYRFIAGQELLMSSIFFSVLMISSLLSFVGGLVYSHKIVGPIYRMRKHLLAAAGGRAPSPLRFRQGDFFQELADAYNEELYSRGRLRRPGSQVERDYREGLKE